MNILLWLLVIILITGCNDLPRASHAELPCDVTKFDQVFNDVCGGGTNLVHGLMVFILVQEQTVMIWNAIKKGSLYVQPALQERFPEKF